MDLPVVTIIGRPNVGKSTLFNRIIRKPLAITDDRPGVTRDRNAHEFEWNGRSFLLVDTGGYVISSKDFMEQAVSEQSRLALEDSDVVLFIADVKTGITDLDSDIAKLILKSGKPVVLGIAKVDNNRTESEIYGFYNLGLGEPMPISGKTGRGSGDLLDCIVELLPTEEEFERDEEDTAVRIALIGRPNVGKSSIVNSITGTNTVLVTDIAGTTRDAIDTRVTVSGQEIVLIDTAGLKRATKLKESLEYYSSLRTLRTLDRCDVAIIVIDIDDGLTSYEKRLISDVESAGKGLVLAANKWDLIEKDTNTLKKYQTEIFDEIPDKAVYPVVFISAKHGQRVKKLIDKALEVNEVRNNRVQTSALNRFVEDLPRPPGSGDIIIYYATQYDVAPPSFAFIVNDDRRVKENFIRFVEGRLRSKFNIMGTPVNISFKRRTRKSDEETK